MLDKIFEIIQKEDKKNPLTDEQIAALLNIKREDVTQFRLKNNIPDSRERRKPYLLEDLKKIIKEDPSISDRNLTRELNFLGYNISRFVVSQLKKEILKEIKVERKVYLKNFVPEEDVESQKEEILSFKDIIGSEGSLKAQISLAKAAVLYPPHGLHTLIVGPPGAGKSQLAEAMYNFAVESGRFREGAPFVVFNCADYADNPQLLMAQLFGYVKGAFTGADTEKRGLVEKANGGILFLDEVHRLPSEGQEILFYLLDKGKFRRLGETENTREAQIMLIAATTENPESALLLTFRRRIPVLIELPSLSERPPHERYEIIYNFFTKESVRLNKTIVIKKEALRALMLYECPGNLGQLRSDIQVACAKSFLASLGSKSSSLVVDVSDLPNHVKMGLFRLNKRDPEIERYLGEDLVVYPDKKVKIFPKEDRYMLPDEIYQFIEERFIDLKRQGLTKEEIDKILSKEMEIELKKFAASVKTSISISKKELVNVVGEKIVNAVEKAYEIARRSFKNLEDNLFYSLAIHLSATYERILSGKPIFNPQLENIIREYPLEYSTAKIMAKEINKELGIELPEEEIGFIAMYLKTFSGEKPVEEGRVGVIVLTHGHVASSMAEVANRLLGVNHAIGIDMALDEKPEKVLERTIEVVKRIDEGKGCIILVDMGSLVTFGEIITKRTGIPTRVVARVDTVMVLEAVRRAIIPETTLDEIADAIDSEKSYVGKVETLFDKKPSKAIVTVCITGEGTALKIKKYIEDLIPELKENYKIIPVGMLRQEDIAKEIEKIRKENDVAAFVGTINPGIESIPFISVEEVLKGDGVEKIKKIIGLKKENPLKEVIDEELIFLDVDAFVKSDVIDLLAEKLYEKGYVDDRFLLSVYKREAMGATILNDGIAIPHGYPEHVIKPAIAIAKLKEPIYWEKDLMADLVFMIALKEESKEYFMYLYHVLTDQNSINKLKGARNPDEVREILTS
ncbi:transcriptional regulatory protein LevR/transcriptional regulator with AAA-type ATPase domain [Caldanaerobacter subterraneus subsp. tengcongensis MB4]|uniref:NtrC family Transcriptional regulator, ATPase domain protein n=1 Tax=Caldanaerobacter subterraneus subsp. tengcongensis (strain DSM 15242 / JCM 11007 / NBRC 100824 / MB4) TaxID=273068 RepID=Q8R5U8_CALS4|nr:sigma 54-interacting transcriptional regulator [Caldanaerobacter subterraneus]AAM23481.1 NtrC family Transcriptional regulator, ATPase domain protein [Caldanaerobacter subterraneus subsp. tengcongensis MB4]MCS3917040.1 transcriptional regulatory protein LevR/transcriptional regulator with AAA-type ATPase domain [Caldanaerobacter subterraneus subsp. tengcongensis MB4]